MITLQFWQTGNGEKDGKRLNKRLGLSFAYHRELAGLSQNQLTERSGQNMYDIENGLKGICSESIMKIAAHINTHADFLFTHAYRGDWTEKEMEASIALLIQKRKNKTILKQE